MDSRKVEGVGSSSAAAIPFPYEPYPQQSALMGAIYDAISSRKSGCFESPTGTGKSLSLICAAMHWQQQEETRIIEEHQREVDASASSAARKPAADDDWLADILQSDSAAGQSAAAVLKKGELERFQAMKARVALANSKDDTSTSSSSSSSYSFNKHRQAAADKGPTGAGEGEAVGGEDDEFVLPMYDSDDGASGVKKGRKKKKSLEAVGDDEDDDLLDEAEDETDLPLPKLFYCSRTHTQIAQFVSEIRRTAYSNARVVTLGSRKLMCLHPEVSRMQSDARMSDACLEMQKSKGKAAPPPDKPGQQPSQPQREQGKKAKTVRQSASCALHTRRLEEKFADRALGQLRDIEELVALGRELKACPYYSARRAVRYAQVVCMPYNVLLHADLRASMGVSLEGAVVVFDEAHNLVDAVNHTHSAELSLAQLDTAAGAVSTYLGRFQFLLGGRNVYYLNLLGAVVRKLRQCLLDLEAKRVKEADGAAAAEGKAHTVLLSTNDFLFRAALDNINLFKLKRHIAETNLVARIGGFSENQARKAAAAAAAAAMAALTASSSSSSSSSSSASAKKASQCASCQPGKENAAQAPAPGAEEETWTASQHALRSLLALLVCLTNNDADGRVALLSTPPAAATATTTAPTTAPLSVSPTLSMRFILLNPSVHFSKIVSQARSVILLGGTLRPFSFISSSLFAGTDPAALSLFSCGHVVAQSSITAIALGTGPRGGALEFTHATRLSKATTDELHGVLLSACQVVPHGFVAFFTSYAYMEALVAAWRASGQLSALQRLKAVFVEPRAASESESVWAQYCAACVAPAGALLLCVMGGKLSEGINFSDHLARCVAVVGMPYPDSRDPILQEKLRHCDALEANSGKKVYEAMCMKSVNQSIGRSIRHVRDYAAILLLDRRYAQPRVISQLPSWIERSVHVAASSAEARAGLERFFAAKAL